MNNSRSIGQIAYKRPLRLCDMEELAAHQRSIEARGGVLFARNPDREQKAAARQKILDLFAPQVWPGNLSMLTMPGVDWRFERKLLGAREPGWMTKLERPRRTFLTCVENDRAIYYGAIADMPGMTTLGALAQMRDAPRFAEHAIKTRFIRGRFFLANVDDLMLEQNWTFDAAWLDYTGPMTVERLKIIEAFWQHNIRHILIVTMLKARFNKKTSDAIERAGGHSQWLLGHLSGEVLHDLEYMDTSPMEQIAIRKIDHA